MLSPIEHESPEPPPVRRWALEQAVRYAEISSIDSDQVVRIADKFRRYAEDGTVPR